MADWLQQLIQWDVMAEQHINQHWANPTLDIIMPLLRNALVWIPLYVFFVYWLAKNYRRQGVIIIAVLLFLVFITDSICAQLLKPAFGRLRPCWNGNTVAYVRMLTGCGGRYSFPSNHAANHFAIATYLFLTVHKMAAKRWWWLFAWAAAICYAQVYVGKHFPLDVIAGAVLGSCLAVLMFKAGNFLIYVYIPNKRARKQGRNNLSMDENTLLKP